LIERWLILADDLSGAADAGAPFARRGLRTEVRWEATPQAPPVDGLDVIAFDTDSRRLDAEAAAARQHAATQRLLAPGTALFKKIDSTLRGQPAAEIAALHAVMSKRMLPDSPARIILAPANPAMGRTTRGGRVYVHGQPLEQTETWRREHRYANADLIEVMASAALGARRVPLSVVRSYESLANALRVVADSPVLVCDAETHADLVRIARACAPHADATLFAGTAGLALALAEQIALRRFAPLDVRPTLSGVLIVVGSLASISHEAARRVAALPGVRTLRVASELLLEPEGSRRAQLGAQVAAALAAGEDLLVEIAPEPAPDLARGPALVRALAECLEPARRHLGGLIVTGGETASALLSGWYFHGVRLIEEVAPGISLGIAVGESRVPLVTKPGGFGEASSLVSALEALRRMRQRKLTI
jgi:uncharacterized protein YgbK (DUF1537 family)